MLSLATVHAITTILLASDDADDSGVSLAHPGTVLLLQDRPVGPPALRMRQARLLATPFCRHLPRRGGLPGLLHQLANTLSAGPDGPAPLHHDDVDSLAAALREPGLRLLAWAVRFDDLHVEDRQLCPIRRIDAVDVDGRVYQISRLHAQTQPVVAVDDHPGPTDPPATAAGLRALLAAAEVTART